MTIARLGWTVSGALFLLWISVLLFSPDRLVDVLHDNIKVGDSLDYPIRYYAVAITILFVPFTIVLVKASTFLRRFSESNLLFEKSEVILIALTIGVFAYSVLDHSVRALYMEDAFFEIKSVVLATLAAAFLLYSSRTLTSRRNRYAVWFLSLCCLLFALEEISYGQRIFGFYTPQLLLEANYQEEANVHNLFNPYFHYFYAAFNLAASGYFLSIRRLRRYVPDELESLLVPRNAELFGVIFMVLAVQSFMNAGELTEAIVSFIVFFSSARFLYARLKATQTSSDEVLARWE